MTILTHNRIKVDTSRAVLSQDYEPHLEVEKPAKTSDVAVEIGMLEVGQWMDVGRCRVRVLTRELRKQFGFEFITDWTDDRVRLFAMLDYRAEEMVFTFVSVNAAQAHSRGMDRIRRIRRVH